MRWGGLGEVAGGETVGFQETQRSLGQLRGTWLEKLVFRLQIMNVKSERKCNWLLTWGALEDVDMKDPSPACREFTV